MIETKTILSITAVAIAIVSYVPYFRDIFCNKTKPHAFTWLVWSVLNGIAFAGQVADGGGVGAAAVGLTAVALFSIFVLALFKGEKDIKVFDWLCLSGAFVALLLWPLTNSPLTTVVLITVIDVFGFLPTVRKSYNKPFQETLPTYALSILKYGLVVVALESYSLVTVLFPASLVILNALFVVMLVVRRRQLAK